MINKARKISKILNSREDWKEKAKRRGSKVRGLRKTAKAHKKQRAWDRQEIENLESKVSELRSKLHARGLPTVESGAVIERRALCVLIVICGIVSFRAVPRILQLLQPLLWVAVKVPHFTSVIHWALRAGIATFRQVSMISEPWVAIIDCSIDIGTRKALVVLRVPLSALQDKQGAIGPQDCECVGLEISHKWDGALVFSALTKIFAVTGLPKAIVKDGGSDLKKGVELFCAQSPENKIYAIDDIGHFAANGLKALFNASKPFKQFLNITSKAAAQIRQTNLASLLPPKIRTKGRFQGITKVAKWARNILDIIGGKGKAENDSDLAKAREAFSGLAKLHPFLTRFCHTCSITEHFLQLMKTVGLNETSYIGAKDILAELPKKSPLRTRLSNWLEKHIDIQRKLKIGKLPILVSSDAIESLFGVFKTIIQRNPQAELNRLIYVLPLLCGNHSYTDIDQALNNCSHIQMLSHIEKTIPPTLRQQRIQMFQNSSDLVPKSGIFQRLDSG